MIIRNTRILLSPDAPTSSGGASVFAGTPDPASQTTPVPEPNLAPTPTPAPEPAPGAPPTATPTVTPTVAPGITAESLAEAMKKAGLGPQAAPAPVQPTKQYTQEDLDKAFAIVRPTKDQVTKLLAGGDEAVLTITELLHAAAKQAAVMSAYQMSELREQLEKRINPLQASIAERNETELRREFYEKYPGFKGFESLQEPVVAKLRESGVTFKNKEEAFAAVVKEATKLIRSIPGQEKWEPGTAVVVSQAQPSSKMPTLAGGGGSGGASASSGNGAQKSKSPGMAVFS